MNPIGTNPPVATPFFFYLLAAVMIVGGILVITRKNAVHSALALITTLLAQAGLYLMLYAPFVAGVQIILYAGGIMVLFLFVIMLIAIERNMKERQFNKQWLIGIAAAAALGVLFAYRALAIIVGLLPKYSFPHEAAIAINVPVLVFSVAVALLTGILFGMWPAWSCR